MNHPRRTLSILGLLLAAALLLLWQGLFSDSGGEKESLELEQEAASAEQPTAEPPAFVPPTERQEESSLAGLEAESESTPETSPEQVEESSPSVSWIRILSQEDKLPLQGALVLSNDGRRWGVPSEGDSAARAVSDAAGYVEVERLTANKERLRIQAAGFSPALVQFDQPHASQAAALVIELSRSASLTVTVIQNGGLPTPGLRVDVTVPSYAITRPAGKSIFASTPRWSAEVGPDGRAQFEDLPTEVQLTATLVDGSETLYREGSPITLDPGEARELEWQLGGGAVLTGRITDQNGQPLAKTRLWLVAEATNAREGRERIYFASSDERRLIESCRSDEDGRFRLEGVQAGDWWFGVAYRDPDSRKPRPTDPSPLALAFSVAEGQHSAELDFSVHRGVFVSGRLRMPDGEVPRHFYLSAYGDLGSPPTREEGDSFVAGPMEPVEHRLSVRVKGNYARTEAISVLPPKDDLVLDILRGSSMAGNFIDARNGERCKAKIFLSEPGTGGMRMGLEDKSDFEFEGLTEGLYDLSARNDDGLVGVLRGVRLGPEADLGNLEIRLQEGAKLRVTYKGPQPFIQLRVLHEGAVIFGDGLAEGTSNLIAVPVGPIEVHAMNGKELLQERGVHTSFGVESQVDFVLE